MFILRVAKVLNLESVGALRERLDCALLVGRGRVFCVTPHVMLVFRWLGRPVYTGLPPQLVVINQEISYSYHCYLLFWCLLTRMLVALCAQAGG